jgi:hypothetical protein
MAPGWPGRRALDTLIQLAVPLFIVAATICRFVGEPRADPLERLARVLDHQTTGQMSQLDQTYLSVLSQLLAGVEEHEDEERDELCRDFRQIVGSMVLLADPLSTVSLAKLLCTTKRKVERQLYLLHSVICVPLDPDTPIHLLHLSFREFLVKQSKCRQRWFAIDENTTHQYLLDRCLALLQSSEGSYKDICQLGRPGVRREEVNKAIVNHYIPPHLQYACRCWVYHLQHSGRKI